MAGAPAALGAITRRPTWPRIRAQLTLAAHPEALPLLLSAVAWAFLIAGHRRETPWGALCVIPRPTGGSLSAGLALTGHLLTMLAAMMLPLVLFQVRHVVNRSYAERQLRGTLAFLAGYLLPWLAVTLAVTTLASAAAAWPAGPPAVALRQGVTLALFAIAALWQLTRLKAELLRQCARTVPLRQDGWRADRACLVYGAATARDCMANCWAPMLAALIRPHDLVTMAIVQAIAISERSTNNPRPRLAALALAATGPLVVSFG